MTVVQSARDAHDNAFCVGSGWLTPRARLDELGGFPQGSICEDLEISYALRGRGWRTLYLNEALADGPGARERAGVRQAARPLVYRHAAARLPADGAVPRPRPVAPRPPVLPGADRSTG